MGGPRVPQGAAPLRHPHPQTPSSPQGAGGGTWRGTQHPLSCTGAIWGGKWGLKEKSGSVGDKNGVLWGQNGYFGGKWGIGKNIGNFWGGNGTYGGNWGISMGKWSILR